jgi:ATP-dependent Clp protease ATP-binding subunit ClpC
LFERYTERARRSIFFARYEASQFGSPEISSAELLLGVLRADKAVALRLGFGGVAAIRREIEALAPKRQKVAASVDLPLSHESKRALAYAAEESERLNQQSIGTAHLVLGLLRVEDSLAEKLLRKHGITLDQRREIARQSPPQERRVLHLSVDFELPKPAPVAPPETSLGPTIHNLRRAVDDMAARVRGFVWRPAALEHAMDAEGSDGSSD